MLYKKLTIYSDGGARGNPGPAGIGAALLADKKVVGTVSKYIGEATNNQAEYWAIIEALKKAKELGAEEVECFLDSELVVKQLNQEYRVKDKDLGILFVKVWNLKINFKKISFHHIRREQNEMADKLANEAMDRGA